VPAYRKSLKEPGESLLGKWGGTSMQVAILTAYEAFRFYTHNPARILEEEKTYFIYINKSNYGIFI